MVLMLLAPMQMGDIHVSARYVSDQYARHMVKRESGGGGEEDIVFQEVKVNPSAPMHIDTTSHCSSEQYCCLWSNDHDLDDWQPSSTCCLPFWEECPSAGTGEWKNIQEAGWLQEPPAL